ncbi:unnamed protein product [Phytomonas sp. Hart1]|nr:unnamed protein product [Phytomonas sp. Hart1]|eukprot:CCW66754.1 unnamed protein product [Phytomonas sp. isolate Hart1]
MKQTVLPSTATGHGVTGPSLVSLGYHEKYLAFVVSSSLLAVTECSGKLNYLMSDSSTVFCMVEDLTSEVISVVRVHDEKDLLLVGTEGHGVYLTTVTSPVLSHATRLPLQYTGEQIFSASFLSVPASQLFSPKAIELYSKTEDLVVLSSAFMKHHETSPHRLSLWHVRDGGLIWRGPMEPMRAICTFPRVPSFAGCTRTTLSLFTLRRAEAHTLDPDTAAAGSSTLDRDAQPGRKGGGGLTLLNRLCDTVEVLRGVEYVHCASCNDSKEFSFLALTATGFLVAFDRFTGAIIRWMDCKVSAASSVSFAGKGNYILLAGAFARFFLSKNWSFCGKVKVESTTSFGLFPEPHFTAGLSVGSCAILFSSRNGHSIQHFVQSSTAPTTITGGTIGTNVSLSGTRELATGSDQHQGHKLRFHQKSFCCPVGADEFEGELKVQWIRPTPSPSPHGTWCLWTRKCLRLYSPKQFLRKQISVNSTCAVYHPVSRVLLTYELDDAGLVAYSGVNEWRLAATLPQTEHLSSLCASDTTDLCAGYCLDNYTVYAFSCCWKSSPNDAHSTLDLVPLWIRPFNLTRGPLNQIFFLGSQLYGNTDYTLVELEGGRLHTFDNPILSLCVVGTDVLIICADSCMYYIPDRGSLKSLNFSLSSPPTCVTYEPIFGLVAISDTHSVHIMHLGDASPFWEVKHWLENQQKPPEVGIIRAFALRVDSMHVVLSILDTHGNLVEYTLKANELSHSSRFHALRMVARSFRSGNFMDQINGKDQTTGSRGARVRAVSEGTPSNRELKDRFDALSGFFAEHKKQRITSGRARSQTLRCRTPSAASHPTRNAEHPAPPSDVSITGEPVIKTPHTGLDVLVPEGELSGDDRPNTVSSVSKGITPNVGLLSPRPGTTSEDIIMKTPTRLLNQDTKESAVSVSAVSVSAMMDVSALTLPTGSHEMKGNTMLEMGLDPIGFTDLLSHRSPSILSRNAARTQMNSDAAQFNAIVSAEDTIDSSFTNFTIPCSRPILSDAAIQPQAKHQETTSGSFSSTSTSKLSEYTRQLRESLKHFKNILDQPDLRFDAEDDAELSKLSSLFSVIATTVKSCRDRQSIDTSESSLFNPIDNALPKNYSMMLLNQLQLIQQQNKHLEHQNQIILEKLSGKK